LRHLRQEARKTFDFTQNKAALKELGIYSSKMNRDVVAGILCKLAKPKEEA
jgi:ribosomal protein S17E